VKRGEGKDVRYSVRSGDDSASPRKLLGKGGRRKGTMAFRIGIFSRRIVEKPCKPYLRREGAATQTGKSGLDLGEQGKVISKRTVFEKIDDTHGSGMSAQ